MCIDLANAAQAQNLAAAVNGGPREPPVSSLRPSGTDRAAAAPRTQEIRTASTAIAAVQQSHVAGHRHHAKNGVASASGMQPLPSSLVREPGTDTGGEDAALNHKSGAAGTVRAPAQTPSASSARPAHAQQAAPKVQADAAVHRSQPHAGVSKAKAETVMAGVPERSAQRQESSSGGRSKPAEGSGRWIMSRFVIKAWGNERFSESTYGTASIVDASGAARVAGDHLYIRNESTKHVLYYGLRRTADEKLEPGQEVTVAIGRGDAEAGAPTRQLITVRWFDENPRSTAGGARPQLVTSAPVESRF
jgi:hypothetical protein